MAPEELFDLLLKQAPDHAFILMDVEGKVVRWRGAASDIFGYCESEMIGQSLTALFTAEDRALGLVQHERDVAASAFRSDNDRWHVRKDGALVWTSGSMIALKVEEQTVAFAKVMSDRTNTRAQIETLQNRLEAATRDLELRKVFFGRLMHEVRNALSPVKHVAALLERTASPEQPSLPITIVKRQVAQLERMADDLTAIAQAEVAKLQLSKEVLDLGQHLREIVETVQSLAEAKKQHVAVLSPSGTVNILADKHRIHQIVFNLLHNAVKYTPEGGKIWVYCSVEAEQAVIRVEDTGVGIAPELLPVIFDLFTQESPEKSGGGFGVGLALVKDLVDAHNGFVEVNCDGKGKGAIFTVRLPLSGH